MLKFLEPERKFTENDADLILLKNISLQCSKHIRRTLGINIETGTKSVSAVRILERLLNLLGLKLKRIDIEAYQINRETLYDERQKIFAVWHQRDELMLLNISGVKEEKLIRF